MPKLAPNGLTDAPTKTYWKNMVVVVMVLAEKRTTTAHRGSLEREAPLSLPINPYRAYHQEP